MAKFSKPPLFQNNKVEFREMRNRGGGRGFVAVRDIEPGELILMETPTAEIPPEPKDRNPAVRCVLLLISGKLDVAAVKHTITDMRILHPRSVDEIDPDNLLSLKKMYQWLFKQVCASETAKAVGLDNADEFIRLVCSLHFNGFATGIYLHLAMINHSCAPNSVKWGARDGIAHSEVRATRRIRAGEEITVSYLVPAMRSKTARHCALAGQFKFTCTCELCSKTPALLEDGPGNVVEALENELEYVEEHELSRQPRVALERVMVAKSKAVGLLGKRHLSLARADVIITEACLAMLDEDNPQQPRLPQQQGGVVFTLLKSSLSIRQTQCLLFSEGVPDEDKTRWIDTRSEAEPTLMHIASGIGFFVARGGKNGLDKVLGLVDDDGERLFASEKEAIECEKMCGRVADSIASMYT
jgi:hypothetical protein